MATDRTKITEVATALGMTGHATVAEALSERPAMVAVGPDIWAELGQALATGRHSGLAQLAFANGAQFAASTDGLSGRPPQRIEWSGGRVVPGDRRSGGRSGLPCQLQVSLEDRPQHDTGGAFEGSLAGSSRTRGVNWFESVAPDAHLEVYKQTISALGLGEMAQTPLMMTSEHRVRLKAALRSSVTHGLPAEVRPAYRELIDQVSAASAKTWQASLGDRGEQERLLWRLLRIYSGPYFILGSDGRGRMCLRVMTPWEWRQNYRFETLSVEAAPAGLPRVDWRATYRELWSGRRRRVEGHVEVRWSHGPFNGMPEAKVYLDTPHDQVPGYRPLGQADSDPKYLQQSLPL